MATMDAPTMDRRSIPERRHALRAQQHAAMSAFDYVALALLIVGGLNWALVALFEIDLVATLFGVATPPTRVVYLLVGLAALYSIYTVVKMSASRRS